ncbi:ABC-2 type transport system permease protein [Bacillus capparidis]|uniref:ABC-2 type transport system permease protein n=2 Tax=Bacillus capparidis TaxID=1840411 RepID=A0ABS4D252_9BACI|nr:ABC-2 type transport system permease protein [Bacillus capparidis]
MNSIISAFNSDDKEKEVAVVDETDQYFELFSTQLKQADRDITVTKVDDETQAEKEVKDEKSDGVFILSGAEGEKLTGTLKAMDFSDSELASKFEQALQQTNMALQTAQLNLSQEELNSLFEPASIERVALEETAKSEEELNQARGLVYIILFVIYISVLMYASMIATEVATEKSSRVMEILISSVSPVQQMFAKLFGVALVGVTQFLIFGLIGYASFMRNANDSLSPVSGFFDFSNIQISTVIYAIVFFLLGYFLYATLAAFLGSIVSRIEDVQQTVAPMTFLVIAGFMIAIFGLSTPDAPFITITSFIPFFAPMIMFLRVGMLNVPFWEVALCIGILLATIAALAVIGARVYKGGVLIYGKSSPLKDIRRALHLSKE